MACRKAVSRSTKKLRTKAEELAKQTEKLAAKQAKAERKLAAEVAKADAAVTSAQNETMAEPQESSEPAKHDEEVPQSA